MRVERIIGNLCEQSLGYNIRKPKLNLKGAKSEGVRVFLCNFRACITLFLYFGYNTAALPVSLCLSYDFPIMMDCSLKSFLP